MPFRLSAYRRIRPVMIPSTRFRRRRRIRRAVRRNRVIPVIKIQPQMKYIHRAFDRWRYEVTIEDSKPETFKAVKVPWGNLLNVSMIDKLPLAKNYNKFMVDRVTLVFKNWKCQVLTDFVRQNPRIEKVEKMDDGSWKPTYFDTGKSTEESDVTRRIEDFWYYWSGDLFPSTEGEIVKSDKNTWNMNLRKANSRTVIRRTFNVKGKSVPLAPFFAVEGTGSEKKKKPKPGEVEVKDDEVKTFLQALEAAGVEGRSHVKHLYVLPDVEDRMFGDAISENVKLMLICDIHVYLHVRLCSRKMQ